MRYIAKNYAVTVPQILAAGGHLTFVLPSCSVQPSTDSVSTTARIDRELRIPELTLAMNGQNCLCAEGLRVLVR